MLQTAMNGPYRRPIYGAIRDSHLPPPSSIRTHLINQDFCNRYIEILDEASSGKFSKELEKVQRASKGRTKRFTQPLAWAIHHIQSRLYSLDSSDEETQFALTFLQSFDWFAMRWKDAPNFEGALRELASSQCYHTLIGLMYASWMCDYICDVHIVAAQRCGKVPDFEGIHQYDGPFTLEVKSPSPLKWPNRDISDERLTSCLLTQIKGTKGQLTKQRPGYLIIASTIPRPSLGEKFEQVLRDLAQHDWLPSSRVLGVGFANTFPSYQSHAEESSFSLHCGAEFRLYGIMENGIYRTA